LASNRRPLKQERAPDGGRLHFPVGRWVSRTARSWSTLPAFLSDGLRIAAATAGGLDIAPFDAIAPLYLHAGTGIVMPGRSFTMTRSSAPAQTALAARRTAANPTDLSISVSLNWVLHQSLVPEDCQEDDDRNRDAYKPEQRTSTEAHTNLQVFVLMYEHRIDKKGSADGTQRDLKN
jgi:hypothetical protein